MIHGGDRMKIKDDLTFEFRGGEVGDSCVSFGCSATYGVGVDHNETWPDLIDNFNHGQPGSSNDRISRLTINYIIAHKPTHVNILWTFNSRREHIMEDGTAKRYTPGWSKWEGTYWHKGYTLISNDTADYHNYLKNKLLVESVAELNGVKLKQLSIEDYDWNKMNYPLGSDGKHPGPEWHEMIANEFNKKVL